MSDIISADTVFGKILNKTEYDAIVNTADVRTDIRIGGITGITEKFVPNINMRKWDDEAWLNINHPDIVNDEKESFVDGKIEIEIGNNIHRYYIDENGHLEYEIVLKTKPVSNKIELDLDFPKGLVFYYQDTLENDYKRSNGGHETLEDYLLHSHRPNNVVGSYAVYWAKRNNQYKTGKFCHIYRPKLIDAILNEEWASISIDDKKLTITLPQSFIDSAKYPVTLDPELGYSTAGSSNFGSNTVRAGVVDQTDGSGGDTTTYHAAIQAVDAVNIELKMGIYDLNQGTKAINSQPCIEQVAMDVAVSDDNNTVAGGYTLSASNWYCLANIQEDGTTKTKYDTGVAGDGKYENNVNYATEMATWWNENNTDDRKWSLWVDYSAAGGATIVPQSTAYALKHKKEQDGQHIPAMI